MKPMKQLVKHPIQVVKARGGMAGQRRRIEHDFNIQSTDPPIVQTCLQMRFPPFEQMITAMAPAVAQKIYDRIKV